MRTDIDDTHPERTTTGTRRRFFAVALIVVLAAGCGDADTDTDTASGAVLVVDGVEYTCDEVIGGDCGPETEAVFSRYKDNLAAFVNAGSLGPLNTGPYENAAFAGLSACVHASRGETAFIDFMLSDPAFVDAGRVDFLPAWFEAQVTLCPDLEFASDVG